GSHERRATFGLNDPEARPDALVPTELAQFVERLPHPDDSGPTSGREKDPVPHPAKGLPDLQEQRLLPLDAVWFPQRRDAEQLRRGREFANDPPRVRDAFVD